MPLVKSLPGIYTRCKAEVKLQSITKQLATCLANQAGGTVYVHLRVRGYGVGCDYWMDLAIPLRQRCSLLITSSARLGWNVAAT